MNLYNSSFMYSSEVILMDGSNGRKLVFKHFLMSYLEFVGTELN